MYGVLRHGPRRAQGYLIVRGVMDPTWIEEVLARAPRAARGGRGGVMVPLALPDPVRESLHARSVRNRQRCAICMDPPHTQTPGGTQSLAAIDANLDRVLLRGIGPGLDGDGALSPGRHCHSTRPSAAISLTP